MLTRTAPGIKAAGTITTAYVAVTTMFAVVTLWASAIQASPVQASTWRAASPSVSKAASVYVALGDSYAAGEGLAPYLPGSFAPVSRCNRSAQAYPSLVAAELGLTLMFRSCGGADTAKIRSGQYQEKSQLDSVTALTTLVTLTVGGNDIDFIEVAGRCTFRSLGSRGIGSPCKDADEASVSKRIAEFRPKLTKLLNDIRARAPKARVVVTTYPRLFPKAPKVVCTVFTPADQVWANSVIDRLDVEIRAAAKATGATVADLAGVFEPDNVLCGTDSYVGDPVKLLAAGAKFDELSNTLHPTVRGQAAIAKVVVATVRPAR